MRISFAELIGVILLLILFIALVNPSAFSGITPSTPSTGTGNVIVNKPLKFTLMNTAAGSAIASAPLKVYDGQALVESLTTDAYGQATTGSSYPSDKVLNVLADTGYAMAWYQVTVPRMSQGDADSLTTNPIRLNSFVTTYNLAITVKMGGTTQTNGSYYDISDSGSTGVISITVDNSADNNVYCASYDPINQVNWKAYIVVSTTGTYASNFDKLSFTGPGWTFSRSTTGYWVDEVPTQTVSQLGLSNVAAFSRIKIGTTYIMPGSTATAWSFDFSGLSSGYTNLTISVRIMADVNNFQTKGVWSPDTITLATYTLGVQA